MTESDVRAWLAEYLSAFAALGRGESTPAEVAAHCYVPLLVTTDDVVIALRSSDAVTTWLQAQADAMSSADYHHTEMLSTAIQVANRKTALVRAHMARRRHDGSIITELSVTYVVVGDSHDLRVQALVVHTT